SMVRNKACPSVSRYSRPSSACGGGVRGATLANIRPHSIPFSVRCQKPISRSTKCAASISCSSASLRISASSLVIVATILFDERKHLGDGNRLGLQAPAIRRGIHPRRQRLGTMEGPPGQLHHRGGGGADIFVACARGCSTHIDQGLDRGSRHDMRGNTDGTVWGLDRLNDLQGI